MTDRFIVAEISKNWPEEEVVRTGATLDPIPRLLAQERGYRLVDWRLSRIEMPPGLNETIIAVFELREPI